MQRERRLEIPQFGVIKGGRLDGWRFHFMQFRIDVETEGATTVYELRVLAKCTPPNWPFPCDIDLDHTHYMQLRAVRGERAKRLDAARLIAAAYSYAGLTPPTWLNQPGKTTTLRATSKRSRTTRPKHARTPTP